MTEQLIQIKSPKVLLEGNLNLPVDTRGLVIFAHGSGSSRFSPRNKHVADVLEKGGLGTLLIDLLSEKEDSVYQTRFNIELLTERLLEIIHWLQKNPDTKSLSFGLFGSSTGAAGALEAAALLGKSIKAVVSRGGRPDLALQSLPKVSAPTLLIVGGDDFGVIELNEQAYDKLDCVKKLEIVPHATHLFEEPGCLDQVSDHALRWFQKYLI